MRGSIGSVEFGDTVPMNIHNLQERGFCPHQYSLKFEFAAGFNSAVTT